MTKDIIIAPGITGVIHSSSVYSNNLCSPVVVILHTLGPNMLFWKMAKKLSDDHFNVVSLELRYDLEGNIGYRNFTQGGITKVRTSLDFLANKFGYHEFVVIGLCIMANLAFNVACADHRVVATILIEPRPDQLTQLKIQLTSKAFSIQEWKQLLNKRFRDQAEILLKIYSIVRRKLSGDIENENDASLGKDFVIRLQELEMRKQNILLLVSDDKADVGYNYLMDLSVSHPQVFLNSQYLSKAYFHMPDHKDIHSYQVHKGIIDSVQNWLEQRGLKSNGAIM